MGAKIGMIGLQFGRLVVGEEADRKGKERAFICLCACGTLTVVRGIHLRTGATTSCGCVRVEVCEARAKSLIGQKFHRLLVTGDAPSHESPNGQLLRKVYAICDCGTEVVTRSSDLRSGRTTSCGCYRREFTAQIKRTHGESKKTVEYQTWCHLISRCENRNSKDWGNYGGRGIKVCEQWRNSYEDFLADMGRKPSPELTIERMNNDGNYERTNCKWATRLEQRHNRRPEKRLRPIDQALGA